MGNRVAVGVVVLAMAAVPLVAQSVATESFSTMGVSISPQVAFERAILRVSGPDGYYGQKSFRSGESIQVDFAGFGRVAAQDRDDEIAGPSLVAIPDGRFNLEVVFMGGGDRVGVHTSTFSVEGGVAIKEPGVADFRDNLAPDGSASSSDGGGLTESTNVDDNINIYDTAGDNATNIWFNNTAYPTNSNWWLHNSDGDMHFREYDGSGNYERVTVERGGDVGIGTTAPAVELHIARSDVDIRLEDTSASGSTWTLDAGDDLSFDLNDDGNGTAIANMLTLEDDEVPGTYVRGVGIFVGNPGARLHVSSPSNDGTAKILVTETNSTTTGRTLFELQNNGNVQFFFQNTDSGDLWQMSQLASVFQVSTPSGSGKFRVRRGGGLQALNGSTTILDLNSTGDLTVKSVTQTSSKMEKRGFESVDVVSVLEKVAALPISEWSYKADNPNVRHLGPMSEDFHDAFGLGKSDKGLTSVDTSGVALAAIQGLNQKLMAENARLEERLSELEELVQALSEH